MLLNLKSFNYSQKVTIMHFVSDFDQKQFFKK